MIQVFKANEYEDGIEGNSTWSEGDFNADGDFDAEDLILAFEFGMYESKRAHGASNDDHDHDHHDHDHPAPQKAVAITRPGPEDTRNETAGRLLRHTIEENVKTQRSKTLRAIATDELFAASDRFGIDDSQGAVEESIESTFET